MRFRVRNPRWSALLMAVALGAGVAGGVGGVGGCVASYHTQGGEGDPQSTAELSQPVEVATELEDAWRKPETWPPRWGRRGGGVGAGGGQSSGPPSVPGRWGVIEVIRGPIQSMRQSEESARRVQEQMLDDSAALLAARRAAWTFSDVTVRGEGPGSYIFETVPRQPGTYAGPTSPSIYLKFISGSRDPSSVRGRSVVNMQRSWLAFYDPAPSAPKPPQPRLAIILPGMFGTPWGIVDQAVHGLRARGWHVLRLLAHPSRFTERTTFRLNDDDRLPDQARAIARLTGDRAAECAYAIEEAMLKVVEMRPELARTPRLAIGMSGGAMVLPTVVARNPDAYGSAVLIAGGADYLRIAAESNYAEWINALRFRWEGPENWPRLYELYRAAAPLDPLYTASALRGKPVLMLHAAEDRAVPAALGDELWQRLGTPERWVSNVGHELIFLSLPGVWPRVMDWAEQDPATGGPG